MSGGKTLREKLAADESIPQDRESMAEARSRSSVRN